MLSYFKVLLFPSALYPDSFNFCPSLPHLGIQDIWSLFLTLVEVGV